MSRDWLYGAPARTYLVLSRGGEAEKLARQFPDFVDEHAFTHEKGGCEDPSARITLQLQRLTDIHLYSDFANPARFADPRQYIYIFSAAALFLLLIGRINYVNLATARAERRRQEVGVAITVEELTT